ncbi:MAG TPA: RDD family protein [Frankiaceae bacterium]|nr:RDD family protein [Frankiaceae bacterium]
MSTYGGAQHTGAASTGFGPGAAGYGPGYAPLIGGEAVPIDLRVARIGSRAVAAIIDLVIEIFALGFLSLLIVRLANLDVAAEQALAVTADVVVLLGYPVICESVWNGRTVGKAAMGLRAARDDGGPLRFRHALVRGLIGLFVEKPGISLGLVAVISSLSSSRGKRLGDLLAGTVVLQVRLPATGAYVPPMPPPLAGWAGTLDLSRLDNTLALQCRQFLGRAGQLSDDARERLGGSLVTSVQAVVTPPAPPGTPGWAYLTAVLAERRRRDELRFFGPPPPTAGWPAPVGLPAAVDFRKPSAPAHPAEVPGGAPAGPPGPFAPPS